jgi:AcrR family transcriptional regulator
MAVQQEMAFATEQRRDLITAAAIEVLATHGIDGLSMAEVAQTAGLAKSVVLYYVSDREGLLRLVVEEVARRRYRLELPLEQPDGDPRRHLGDWIDGQFEAAQRADSPHRLMWLLQLDGELKLAEMLSNAENGHAIYRLGKLLTRGNTHACWQVADPKRAATAVRTLVDGFLLHALAVREDNKDFQRLRAACRGAVMDMLVR